MLSHKSTFVTYRKFEINDSIQTYRGCTLHILINNTNMQEKINKLYSKQNSISVAEHNRCVRMVLKLVIAQFKQRFNKLCDTLNSTNAINFNRQAQAVMFLHGCDVSVSLVVFSVVNRCNCKPSHSPNWNCSRL